MKSFFTIFAILVIATRLSAQSNSAPIRLAIVSAPSTAAVADVLTVEFTKNNQVSLLERSQIEKVYQEQALSAADKDSLKLGRILGADGLLLLETTKEGADQFLNVRLVAVKPGIVLSVEKFSWPIKNLPEWSASLAKHFDPFFPKLTVLAKDAVPISVVNFHSAVQSAEAQEAERQLKLLAIQRLSQERQFFVLERQKMQLLGEEKDLKPDESAFWNGSYLLEGVVDQNGYSPNTITVDARLTPPKGATPLLFEISGDRTNLAAVMNQLAVKVADLLKINATVREWNTADEAMQYFDDAKWACQWSLWHEAQEASESAWALGMQTKEMATLRLQSYLGETPFFSTWAPARYSLPEPDPANLDLAIRILELFDQRTRQILAEPGATDWTSLEYVSLETSKISGYETYSMVTKPVIRAFSNNIEWFDLGLRALNTSDAILQDFNVSAEGRSGHELKLAELRALCRQTETILEADIPLNRGPGGATGSGTYMLKTLKWEDGGLWFDKPEEALLMYGTMLQSGFRTSDLSRATGDSRENRDLPQIVAWSWEDRKRIPNLLRQFAASSIASTNQELQVEGLLYKLILTPYDSSGRLDEVQNELYQRIWEQRQSLFAGGFEASVMGRIEEALGNKYGSQFGHEELFHNFKQRLREDYLKNIPIFDRYDFEILFSSDLTISKMEELHPFVGNFTQRLKLSSNDAAWVEQSWKNYVKDKNSSAPVEEAASVEVPQLFPADSKSVTVKFTGWKLEMPSMNPRLRPIVQSAIIRQGKLWVEIQCINVNVVQADYRAVFASVDLETGLGEVILFPPESGLPAKPFEVTADSLYVVKGNRLERYRFQTKRWEAIPIPTDGEADILEINGRLYLGKGDAVLELAPDSQKIEILASSRRRPAANALDGIGAFGNFSRGPQGKLMVSAQQRFFAFSPASRVWEEVPTLLSDAIKWHVKIGVRYEKDGQPFDPIAQHTAQFEGLAGPFDWPVGPALKLDTTQGRIVINRGCMGHWLIPKTVLVSSLEDLRNFYRTNTAMFQKP